MIITVEELKQVSELSSISDEQLTLMCEGIEDFIRQYTNNNFINKNVTFNTPSLNGKLDTVSPLFKVGDTVLISNSKYNNGVYVINDLDGTLDKELFDDDNNKVTLVKYPHAIKLGVVKLLQYNAKMDSKVGISSESLSRHSVSYAQPTSDSIGGYPASMLSFLKPYMKARF